MNKNPDCSRAGVQGEDPDGVVEKHELRVELALRGHKRHFQGVRGERGRLLFGRRAQGGVSESVAGLPGAGPVRRSQSGQTAVAAPAAGGGRRRGCDEDTAAASAQGVVDPGPEKRRDDGRGAVRPANATGRGARGRAQVAGGAVRAQQGVSRGAVAGQEAGRRAEGRHQSVAGTAPDTGPPAETAATTQKDEHTARRAPAKQRGQGRRRRRGRGRHGHGEEKEEMTTRVAVQYSPPPRTQTRIYFLSNFCTSIRLYYTITKRYRCYLHNNNNNIYIRAYNIYTTICLNPFYVLYVLYARN